MDDLGLWIDLKAAGDCKVFRGFCHNSFVSLNAAATLEPA